MLILRSPGDPCDEVRESVALQEGVGVDRDQQRRRHHGQGRVQGSVLARLRLDDSAEVQAEACSRFLGPFGCEVGRAVVGEEDRRGPGYERSAIRSSVRTIASSSFLAAITSVTGGHSPSAHEPGGGPRAGGR